MNILELQLATQHPEPLAEFYEQVLGFRTTARAGGGFTLRAGRTRLAFVPGPGAPYYHFAFNIPSRQIAAAADWLKARTPLLTDQGREIIDFSNWQAEAVYFEDPAGNIVELIARRDLRLPDVHPFSAAAVHEVSEIGLPVPDVAAAVRQLTRQTGVPDFWGGGDTFRALGDHHGLFIVVDRAEKTWYPTETPARSAPLRMRFETGEQLFDLDFADGEMRIALGR